MTPPRQISPGQTCFITVRAVNRSYRFVPKRDVRDAIAYCLAVSASKFRGRVALHEFLWMSNHFHLVLTDVTGCLPRFMEALDSLLSRALNALRGTNGTNIEKGYNRVIVYDDQRLFEHCVYTLANPCRAHLVVRTRHWEGVSSLKLEYGVPLRVRRPRRGLWADRPVTVRKRSAETSKRACYAGRSSLPAVAELVLERPRILPELTDAELRRRVRAQLDARERSLIELRRSSGRGVLGWKAVVKASFWTVPGRHEEMFDTVPSFSASDPGTRVRAAQTRRAFLNAYRAALGLFMSGERGVQFPFGTWLMKVRFGVACCPSPET